MPQWLVIGISGVTCGGKTTLAHNLREYFKSQRNGQPWNAPFKIGDVQLISQDDYFLPVNDLRHKWNDKLNVINFELITSLDMRQMLADISWIINGHSPHHNNHQSVNQPMENFDYNNQLSMTGNYEHNHATQTQSPLQYQYYYDNRLNNQQQQQPHYIQHQSHNHLQHYHHHNHNHNYHHQIQHPHQYQLHNNHQLNQAQSSQSRHHHSNNQSIHIQHYQHQMPSHISARLVTKPTSATTTGRIWGGQIIRSNLQFVTTQFSDNRLNILIIEGFMIFNQPELLTLCNLKFHFHLPYEKCFERRRQRTYDPPDVTGYFEVCVWPHYEKNFAEFRDRKDITMLNGEMSKEKIFKFILQKIITHMEDRRDILTTFQPPQKILSSKLRKVCSMEHQ